MIRPITVLLLVSAATVGCRRAKTDPSGKLDLETWTEAAPDGWVEVQVDVSDQHGAFMVSAQTWDANAYMSVEEVWDPNGNQVMSWEDWDDSDEWIGDPFSPWYKDVFLNWPIREQDGPLDPGTWSVIVSAVNANWSYMDVDMDISVQRKRDDDLTSGTVHAWVVYAKGVKKEQGVEKAVEAAVDQWASLWAPYGLELEVEYGNMPGLDPSLPVPGTDSHKLAKLSRRSNGEQVVVVIGETVDGDGWTYGMSGGIPGPMIPSDRSAIVVSWLVHAGDDAKFTNDEVRVFGGTLAHEVGHYMGLPHPVEDGFETWDALDDTPNCTTQTTCEDELGPNLMFPYSICDWDSCSRQETLTDDQVALAQRYCAVL